MKYEALRERVCNANQMLVKYDPVTLTWGNVSEADREAGVFAIEPLGVAYDDLWPEDTVVSDLEGEIASGALNSPPNMEAHLEFYKAFPAVSGIAHIHSPYAMAWAQTGLDIPRYGITHTDHFYSAILCARGLIQAEIDGDYGKNTGVVIIEISCSRNLDPGQMPGVICQSHGPFAWRKDAVDTVYHAVVAKEVAKMAALTWEIRHSVQPASQWIQDEHYQREHGFSACYG